MKSTSLICFNSYRTLHDWQEAKVVFILHVRVNITVCRVSIVTAISSLDYIVERACFIDKVQGTNVIIF